MYRQASHPGDGSGGTLTLTELRQVHRMVMTPVWDVAPHPDATRGEAPGNFREQDIRPFPGGMTPPSWVLVPPEVEDWLRDVAALRPRSLDFPDRLAGSIVASRPSTPFLDGNGRTGRLLLNLVLVRLGYPPAIIYKRQRAEYLRALRRADGGDCGLLGELLARAVLDNLYKFVVATVAGPVRLVPLAALATPVITADALRTAAGRGRLEATRGADGEWRSSRKWVDEYLDGRYRRDQ